MSLTERIRERRKQMKMTQSDFAEAVKVSLATVRRWEGGKTTPNGDQIKKIAELFGTTGAYLMGETDNPERSAPQAAFSRPEPKIESNAHFTDVIWVPVVSNNVKVCCGAGNAYPEEIIWEEVGKYPIMASDLMGYSWQIGDGGYHIITVEGDSMEPRVHGGDKILIADVQLGNSDLAVCFYKGRILLRGVTFEEDYTHLHAWNKDYEDIIVPKDNVDELSFLGKMIGIVPPIQHLSSMW